MQANLPLDFERRTKRLVLRFLRKDDYPVWLECFSNTLNKKNRWDFASMEIAKTSRSEYATMLSQYRSLEKAGSAFRFGVFEKKSGAMIGFSLVQHIVKSPIYQSGEIGWSLNNRYWGQGFATEFTAATIKIAYEDLGLWRVEAAISRRNIRSIAVAKKLGFLRIGLSRGHFLVRGEPRDMVLYSKTQG